MKQYIDKVENACLGTTEDELGKEPRLLLDGQLSGFVGDRHGSYERKAWDADDK
jgi:hypothetical protein